MGKGIQDIAPGLTDVWKLWRHCLCRFGWYPIFVAPLITCAAFMDLYSSTGCDFIRLDIGFVPVNEVWPGPTAYLGLFGYDSFEVNTNKWKRSFNNGCQAYSTNFESVFIGADQTWQITRILAYISGCASLVAVATAWLLTITPLPASFLWPGVLLPAAILSMLTGAAKFLFFDARICSEDLWFEEGATEPQAPNSCNIGDSAVYAIASVCAYFLCTILICVRSPQKRTLDPDYGSRENDTAEVTTDTQEPAINNPDPDPERGGTKNNEASVSALNVTTDSTSDEAELSAPSSPLPQQIDISQPNGAHHVRTSSDVTTWTASSNQLSLAYTDSRGERSFRVLSPTKLKLNNRSDSNVVWDSSFGAFIAVDDESREYFNTKTQRRSNKSPSGVWKSPDRLPPLASSIRSTSRSVRQTDSGSVCSKISKVSFAETHFSEESFFQEKGSIASSANSAPSVVSIPKKIVPSPQRPTKYQSNSSPNNRFRPYREDRNDAYSDFPRLDSKRDRFEHLPRLDELSSPRSNDDHGELINQCLKDLKQSFGEKEYGSW